MENQDLFGRQASVYATFRPLYPAALYDFLMKHVRQTACAWDCGTGNGQVARQLAVYFDTVFATDRSQQQLEHAPKVSNVIYSVTPAEQTSFASNMFDLITVAQALHWFDTAAFYREAARTSKKGGLLAVWGYNLPSIDTATDRALQTFYHDVVGPFWDDARRHVDQRYRDIPFPFQRIPAPALSIKASWTIAHFAGYLSSWSATQQYIKAHQKDPVGPFINGLHAHWKKDAQKMVTFQLFINLGRID